MAKQWQDPSLQEWIGPHKECPARDQVYAGKWRVGHHILPGEYAHVANGLRNLVFVVRFDEKAPQSLGRHVLRNGLRISPGPRFRYRRFVHIGCENPDRDGVIPDRLHERDRKGIDLLSCRTSRHPDAERLLSLSVLNQLRKDLRAENIERARIAEEASDRNQEVLIERLRVFRVSL